MGSQTMEAVAAQYPRAHVDDSPLRMFDAEVP